MATARERKSLMHPYEARFAAMFGEEFRAFAFWKGRIALYAILKALDFTERDDVLLPGYTCVVVPNAVRYTGATAIYADIASGGYNLDPVSVEQRITPRTRALIVQHTYGIPADIDALSALARRHRLCLIEDCAHVLPGFRHQGHPLGAHGQAAFFSFQWSKPYTTGLGGMVVTQDQGLAERLRDIQKSFVDPPRLEVLKLQIQYALYQRLFRPRLHWSSRRALHLLSALGVLVGSSSSAELAGKTPADLQWKMSVFQQGSGLSHLLRLEDNEAHRRHLVQYYSDALRQQGWPAFGPDAESPTLLRYPLLVANKAALMEKARHAGIELGTWFETPLHPLALSEHYLAAYQIGSCPVAESTAASVINLPLHGRVTRPEAERIIQFVLVHARQPRSSQRQTAVRR
jgi:dTDP-4-amino-4,6-dideoxygalactose transaminase